MKPKSSKRVNEQRQRQRWLLALRHNWWHQIHIQWDLTCPGQNGLLALLLDQAVWLWDETIFLALLTERRWKFYFDSIAISNRIENFKIESMVTSVIWKTPFFQLKSRFHLPNTTGAKKRRQRRKNWVSAFNWQTREREKKWTFLFDWTRVSAPQKKNLITFNNPIF